MSGNSGAWGIAMWKDGYDQPAQNNGISLSGGDEIDPFLPTVPLGFLTVPPEGLGVPALRNGDVAFAQRDGVVQLADYYEPRQITLQVVVPNEGCPGCPSARQAVARLTREWSRNCSGATLVIFSDCHDPDATEQEKEYLGPYLVHGRPRVAEVTWRRSNIGGAIVLLRFDAADARLVLASTLQNDEWTGRQVQTVDAAEQNLLDDPTLSGLTMTLNGATVEDSHLTSGGPDSGAYFQRFIEAPNTTSPMTMALMPSGTGGFPVTPGEVYSVAFWARKSMPGGPDARVDWTFYEAGGAVVGAAVTGTVHSPTADWERFTQDGIVVPASAAFVQFRLSWTGIALEQQRLDFAQAWLNEGATAFVPETMEVVGSLCAYPLITLFPDLTAPIVVTYGGHEFTYSEDVLIGEGVIEISTRWGHAANSNVDVTDNLSGDFSSPLPPGVHEVTVQTGNPADTGFVNINWENAVVSG